MSCPYGRQDRQCENRGFNDREGAASYAAGNPRRPRWRNAPSPTREEDVWRFSDVIGNPKFTEENLPKFAAFFDRVVATEGAVVDPAKDF